MSTGFKEDGTTCKLLLTSAEFLEFVNYVGELSAAPGSRRATNPKNRQPLEVGNLPTRPKVKISDYYKIAGVSWLIEAPKHRRR